MARSQNDLIEPLLPIPTGIQGDALTPSDENEIITASPPQDHPQQSHPTPLSSSQEEEEEEEAANPHHHRQQHYVINRNIRFTLIYTCFAFAGRSIWSQSVLATYVYLLTNDNPEAVGFMTAVMGLAQLVASLPTGYLTDAYCRRDTMLKVASAVGLVAIAVTLLALYSSPRSYTLLVLALAVWGVLWGIANTALGALFADSIADGDRSYYFTQRSILINLGNTVGPALALIMFLVLGDNWTVRDCAIVMTLGQTVCLPAVFILTLFNDDDTTIIASRATTRQEQVITTDEENDTSRDLLRQTLLEDPVESNDSEETFSTALTNHENVHDEVATAPQIVDDNNRSFCGGGDNLSSVSSSSLSEYLYGCIPKQRVAPILISIADLTSGLASGMSIRYFPIFFVDTLHLSPVQVQILYIVAPLFQACLMKSGQFFSRRFGRCLVTIAHKWIGITCMALVVVFSHLGLPAWLICIAYVLRTAFMNSTSPLTKSILMDNVPTHERGRWSALESVNMFSWSGSAAFGGFLVSWNGLLFNFSITAMMQLLATIPVIALMWAVNVDEHRPSDSTSDSLSS